MWCDCRYRGESGGGGGGGTYPLSGLESALGLCFPNALQNALLFQIVYPQAGKVENLRLSTYEMYANTHTNTRTLTYTRTHQYTPVIYIYCREYIATIRPIMRIVEQYAICQLVERSSWGCQPNSLLPYPPGSYSVSRLYFSNDFTCVCRFPRSSAMLSNNL